MQIPRIYQDCELIKNAEITLDQRAFHHLINVLRLSVDHPIVLFNGQGGEFTAYISQIHKKMALARIESFSNISRELDLKIHLIQGVSKSEKMDFVIQKATELGVTEITPIMTERCNVKLPKDREEKRFSRWQQIIISACEQSGRNTLPILNETKDVWGQSPFGDSPHRIILQPNAEKNLKDFAKQNFHEATILIGPEGGFTEAEINLAYQNNFIPVNMGPRILRTETATIAILAVLQTLHD